VTKRAILAAFLGSFVMFALEPALGRMILPWAGGGPSVWTACLVFFQAALLLGYGGAHVVATRLRPRAQAAVVLGVLAVGLAFMPIAVPDRGATSTAAVIRTLALAAGVPFVALATLAPTLQRWAHAVTPEREPYRLYAASNAGSLVGLVAYPLAETMLGLHAIARVIAAAYAVLFVAAIATAIARLRARAHEASDRAEAPEPIRAPTAARWLVLALVPSGYLAAVTTHVTVEIAPIPLLWAIPLAAYLATFVIAFAGAPRAAKVAGWILPALALGVAFVVVARWMRPAFPLGVLHVGTFFVAALVCHSELARLRPAPAQATAFYLCVALGGVLGGVLVAFVAPLVFDQYLEYPLLLLFALVLAPPLRAPSLPRLDLPFAVGVGAIAAVTLWWGRSSTSDYRLALFPGLPLLVTASAWGRPRRFALALGLTMALASGFTESGRTLLRERSFFGALRVARDPSGKFTVLAHGTTVHGRQLVDPKLRRIPTSYYARSGPAGDVFDFARSRIAQRGTPGDFVVVGLGTGTLAAHALPGERFTFVEIDPAVVRVATDPKLFTFLSDAFPSGGYDVREGDARVVLPGWDRKADLLVLDAFSGDAIPMHLLTVEAGRIWTAKAGLVALHVSNRHVDLGPVVARLARELGLVAFERDDILVDDDERALGKSASDWMLLGPERGELEDLPRGWMIVDADEQPAWTDDRASLLPLLR
jgi:hypothetical protein